MFMMDGSDKGQKCLANNGTALYSPTETVETTLTWTNPKGR